MIGAPANVRHMPAPQAMAPSAHCGRCARSERAREIMKLLKKDMEIKVMPLFSVIYQKVFDLQGDAVSHFNAFKTNCFDSYKK